jgi:hypothetical protein
MILKEFYMASERIVGKELDKSHIEPDQFTSACRFHEVEEKGAYD